ncbi:MAG: hypothetical protein OXI22_09845 [Defluviicoccus sp.]|nr:hypothetical protein [Defluviicoccus sp.]MDE0384175.1 hypothetical protein [Defluviicoccus sp.]
MAGTWHGPAQGPVEDRLERMEQRVADRDRTIVDKDRRISALAGGEDDDTDEPVAATVEVGVAARADGWAGADRTGSIETAVASLGLNKIAFEGWDSLDNPAAVFE